MDGQWAVQKSKPSRCDSCKKVVADSHFALRRAKGWPGLDKFAAFDVLEKVCLDVYNRHQSHAKYIYEVCDEMWEDDDLVMRIAKGGGEREACSDFCRKDEL